jgi:hypothetical protein
MRTLRDFDDHCFILELLSEKEIATIYWKDCMPDEQKQMQTEVALKSLEKKSELSYDSVSNQFSFTDSTMVWIKYSMHVPYKSQLLKTLK